MTVSKIEAELLAASKLKEKKNEDRQDYLARLMRSVAKLPDDVWEGISSDAQTWNNDAAEAYKAGVVIADFPDLEADASVDADVDEEEEVKAAPKAKAKTNGNGQHEKPAAKNKEKVAEAPRSSSPTVRKVSACHTIKKLVVKKPNITVAELSEKLKADGLKVSDVTIATLRSDLRDTLRVLNELNIATFTL